MQTAVLELNLSTCANFGTRYSISNANIGLPQHLRWSFSWNQLTATNATKSFILDAAMVLDTSPCFFGKPSSPTGFITYLRCTVREGLFENIVTFTGRRVKKYENSSILDQGNPLRNPMTLRQKYEERIQEMSCFAQHYFQAKFKYFYRYLL